MSEQTEQMNKLFMSGKVFTPSAPISVKELFAGRTQQVSKVINAITQPGQHAIIYGERGVGKTSMANVIRGFLPNDEIITTVKVNCDSGMNFKDLFSNILEEIKFQHEKTKIGFGNESEKQTISLKSISNTEDLSPHKLRKIFSELPGTTIIIIDELDRITDKKTRKEIADTIKNFSDYIINTTFILVGVADSVENLISEHQSIERALVQIKMPRMSKGELNNIINNGISQIKIVMKDEARDKIVNLSQGLPNYTHLLALHSCQTAIKNDEKEVDLKITEKAIEISIDGVQQTILDDYHKAINSPKGNLYQQVLLACAMTEKDDLGCFSAKDMKGPMKKIMKKEYDVSSFSRHLKQFCDKDRGPILKKTGHPRRFRYKFINPLMGPFVIMNGLSKKIISSTDLL